LNNNSFAPQIQGKPATTTTTVEPTLIEEEHKQPTYESYYQKQA